MMRQTASFQINLDFDDEPALRWQVLNAAAPCLVAVFANSSVYDGADTGCPSTRAQVWRALDPARTGLPWARAAVPRYLEFALEAPALLLPCVDGEHRRFGEWLARARVSLAQWHDHLSTLFPEVRPRGHLELRSADAVAPEWYAAPLALAAGITYDPGALRAAADLLGEPDPALLERAGRLGLRDPRLARIASDLAAIALQGCAALGPAVFHPADLETAAEFFERYTYHGRCPADELRPAEVAA
jgi:glutamate--cysteine ligase